MSLDEVAKSYASRAWQADSYLVPDSVEDFRAGKSNTVELIKEPRIIFDGFEKSAFYTGHLLKARIKIRGKQHPGLLPNMFWRRLKTMPEERLTLKQWK